MSLDADLNRKLNAPLNPARVQEREGSRGMKLSYLTSHDVIRCANALFGFGQWGTETVDLTLLGEGQFEKNGKIGWRVGYRCTVRLTVAGCVPTDGTGYGDAIEYGDSPITAHELAVKEAESDAEKRALRKFGDQFGLILWAKPGDERQRVEREAAIRRERAAKSSVAPGAPADTRGEHGTESVEAATVSVPQPASPAASTPATGPGGDGASSGPSPFAPPASVPVQKPANAKQKALLNALFGRVCEEAKRVTREELWAWAGHEPPAGERVSFAMLRDRLTIAEASGLIEHLTALEEFAVADGALEPRRAA